MIVDLDNLRRQLAEDAGGYPCLLSGSEASCLTIIAGALRRERASAAYLEDSYRDDSATTAIKAQQDPSYRARGWMFWKRLRDVGAVAPHPTKKGKASVHPSCRARIVAHWLVLYGVRPDDAGVSCVERDLYVVAVAGGAHSAALDISIPLVSESWAPRPPVAAYEGAA